MQTDGVYFDGETAAERLVTVMIENDSLAFSGASLIRQRWRFADLVAVDPPRRGQPLRLTHVAQSGARLIVRSDTFIAALTGKVPGLRGGFKMRRLVRPVVWIAAGFAAVVVAAYLAVQFAPQKLAFALPDSWRDRIGAQIEASLTEGARRCRTASGQAAISAMAARLGEGNPDLPPVAIHVYDIPIINAFAMPGGRIVITRALIERAATPEEVAGVLAHELGHVVYRHSEAQIIRAMGLQVVIGLATGGGDTISSFAGLAAILRYSRGAEANADEFALKALTASSIDPMGLRRFFELVLKEEGKAITGNFGKISSAFATHPGTEERIKNIRPLPPDILAKPVMDEAKWQALRKICE